MACFPSPIDLSGADFPNGISFCGVGGCCRYPLYGLWACLGSGVRVVPLPGMPSWGPMVDTTMAIWFWASLLFCDGGILAFTCC